MPEEALQRTNRILAQTPQLKDELLQAAATGKLAVLDRFGISPDVFQETLSGSRKRAAGLEGMLAGAERAKLPAAALEAIVRVTGRPPLLVRNGTYEKPPAEALRKQLEPHRKHINKVIASTGRIEFRFHRMPWGGTGWMIDRNIAVTNRHVAELVAEAGLRGGFRFRCSPIGRPYEARLDFNEEQDNPIAREAKLIRVCFLAASRQPDIALFEVEADFPLPEPVPLQDAAVKDRLPIGVVGYPADDPDRNDPERIRQYFGDVFEAKRFAAGEVSQAPEDGILMHDATTLGGNSGSVVFDLATGNAVGLHFSGEYRVGNYAVDAATVRKTLRGLKTVVRGIELPPERKDGQHKPAFFAGRDGYQADFLGAANKIPLPSLKGHESDAAEAVEADGAKTKLLNYRHFSVRFSKSRKAPFFTAVNINGESMRKVKRGNDQWFQDLRISRELQLGQKEYGRRVIDRGHMVRREDPVWGTPDEALQANFDTFHYTNAAPQHAELNERKNAWLGLEDYILTHTRTEGFKVSVFTGPILRLDDPVDPEYPELGRIPREFWKVVAAIDSDAKKVYATGYVLSQGKMIADFTEAIVFAEWNSYQVPISMIAAATGFDFGVLVKVDTLAGAAPKRGKRKRGKGRVGTEAVPTASVILLESPESVYLGESRRLS
jgi:endonuclease G